VLDNRVVLDQSNLEKSTEIQNTFDIAEANEMHDAMLMEPATDEMETQSSHIYHPEPDQFTDHVNLNEADNKQENDVKLSEPTVKKCNRAETEDIIARCISDHILTLGLKKDMTYWKRAFERCNFDVKTVGPGIDFTMLLNYLSGDPEKCNYSKDELSNLEKGKLLLVKKSEEAISKLEVSCLNI